MKTDKITFGQTYIRPTLLNNISPENQEKVLSLIGLGELYPADVYLGANYEGDLIIDVLHTTLAKHLYFSGEVPKTSFNASILQFMHSMEKIARKQNQYKLPIYNIKIKNLDYFDTPDLQYTVHEKIANYFNKIIDKRFFN